MTKEEVDRRFFDVLSYSDQYDPIGAMQYDILAVERYMRKKRGDKEFTIYTVPVMADDDTASLEIKMDSLPPAVVPAKGAFVLLYVDFPNHLMRLQIALSLWGIVAPTIVSDVLTGGGSETEKNRSFLFALKLLEKRVEPGDEFSTRKIYTGSREDIIETIRKTQAGAQYDPENLPQDAHNALDSLVSEIHSLMDDEGVLEHDTRLLEKYFAGTNNPCKIYKRASERFDLSGQVPGQPMGKVLVTNDNIILWYANACKSAMQQRAIVAHELGEIACHRKLGSNEPNRVATEAEEREAWRYARLLLENRARRYLKGLSDAEYEPAYKKAKAVIATAIRSCCSGYSDEFIKWVMDDR